jgi:hypothetical protein
VIQPAGSVLGLDVGFSLVRRSSAVCRLDWDENSVSWTIARYRADPAEMRGTIGAVGGAHLLLAAAFDGPFRAGFDLIDRHRAVDQILTRRLGRKIGKPGQVNVPSGRLLNAATNACVQTVLAACRVGKAGHAVAVHERAVVEAFPHAFLGTMLADPTALTTRRSDRSDVYYEHLAANGGLQRVVAWLLPGRQVASFATVTNHDDRAALVCALAALCVAADDYSAVGNADGWVILPPGGLLQAWAQADLAANVAAVDCRGGWLSGLRTGAQPH